MFRLLPGDSPTSHIAPRVAGRWRQDLTQGKAFDASPGSNIWHGKPRLGWGERGTCLQKLNRDIVGGPNESHSPVTRRPVDDDALVLQLLTDRVDVVDGIGQMPEVAPTFVDFRIPIIGQLDHGSLLGFGVFVARGAEEDQGETTAGVFCAR